MLKNYWFASDLHLNHKNICKYSNRPFISLEEMNEILIQNWNNCVKNQDDVYFLGDFCMGESKHAITFRKRLQGNIHFIEGNHDKPAFQISKTFAWYKQVATINVFDQRIFLSHYAHRVWNGSHHQPTPTWHLFGHSHNTLVDDPKAFSSDVGVDAIANRLAGNPSGSTLTNTKPEEYRPINFEEVKEIMSKKTWEPVDHHGR